MKRKRKSKVIERGWMIWIPLLKCTILSCEESRERAIHFIEQCKDEKFEDLEQRGYRCVRVEIKEVTK